MFEELEIAEKNLNSNLDNVDLYNNFVETAEKVKKKLKEKYADQWTDPNEGSVKQESGDDEWACPENYLSFWIINKSKGVK